MLHGGGGLAYLKAAIALIYAAGVLMYPDVCVKAARGAMEKWALSVAPALFPYAAVMPFLTCDEARRVYEKLLGPVARRLFRLPGGAASAIVTGMVSGSPGGAMAVVRVAAVEGLTRGETGRLAAIAGGLSPVYIISVLGVGLNGSRQFGLRMLAAQLIAQLGTGILFRNSFRGDNVKVRYKYIEEKDRPVRNAALACVSICGYMVLFSVGIELAAKIMGEKIWSYAAFIDLPCGAEACVNDVLLAGAVGFGGACICAQCIGVLEDMVKPWVYCVQRAVGGAICAAAFYVGGFVIKGGDRRIWRYEGMDFEKNLLILMVIMVPVMLYFLRKRSKKHFS